jgi:hypothetical protein
VWGRMKCAAWAATGCGDVVGTDYELGVETAAPVGLAGCGGHERHMTDRGVEATRRA